MDISLNAEQRQWQAKAREFAQDEIRPLSLRQDRIADVAPSPSPADFGAVLAKEVEHWNKIVLLPGFAEALR